MIKTVRSFACVCVWLSNERRENKEDGQREKKSVRAANTHADSFLQWFCTHIYWCVFVQLCVTKLDRWIEAK